MKFIFQHPARAAGKWGRWENGGEAQKALLPMLKWCALNLDKNTWMWAFARDNGEYAMITIAMPDDALLFKLTFSEEIWIEE